MGFEVDFYYYACLKVHATAQCRTLSDVECYTTGDQICQVWKYRGYRKTTKGEIFKWAIFGITMEYGTKEIPSFNLPWVDTE